MKKYRPKMSIKTTSKGIDFNCTPTCPYIEFTLEEAHCTYFNKKLKSNSIFFTTDKECVDKFYDLFVSKHNKK